MKCRYPKNFNKGEWVGPGGYDMHDWGPKKPDKALECKKCKVKYAKA